jgi:chromosome segregation ATPase
MSPLAPILRILVHPVAPLALVLAASTLSAQQPAAGGAEAKLREQLRATLIQLRTAETEKANLQAGQAALEAQNKALAAELEAKKKEHDTLVAESEAAQLQARKEIGELTGRLSEREADLVKHRAALEKWRLAHRQVTGVAQKKEEQRAAAAQKIVELERTIADRERKNVELYKVGDEILSRYAKFGFGDALAAREPFTGLTRTKLESLVQDYKDRLLDNVTTP